MPPPLNVPLKGIPIHLSKLPRPLNSKMVYELAAQEGGMCEIAVQLHPDDAEKLGHFRIHAGSAMPYQPLSTIQLFHRYPASGRPYYEDFLSRIARDFAPFRVTVKRPFLLRHELTNVGFDVWARELNKVYRAVWEEIKAIRPLRVEDSKVFPFRPALFVQRGLEATQAEKMLKVAKKTHRETPAVTALVMGIGVRHAGQPAFKKAILYREEDRKWSFFPFERKEVLFEDEKEMWNVWKRDRKQWKLRENGLFLPP